MPGDIEAAKKLLEKCIPDDSDPGDEDTAETVKKFERVVAPLLRLIDKLCADMGVSVFTIAVLGDIEYAEGQHRLIMRSGGVSATDGASSLFDALSRMLTSEEEPE